MQPAPFQHVVLCWRALFFTVLLLVASSYGVAQAVHLPIARQTTVGTTIMVPDGGTAHLGSVGRAQEGRTGRGGVGRHIEATAIQSTVRIIDLHAMDEEILAQRPATPVARDESRHPMPPVKPFVGIATAEEHRVLAETADRRGKPGVARLHRQMAATLDAEKSTADDHRGPQQSRVVGIDKARTHRVK